MAAILKYINGSCTFHQRVQSMLIAQHIRKCHYLKDRWPGLVVNLKLSSDAR